MWRRPRLRVASRRRRALADTIDAALVLLPWLGYVAFKAFGRRQDPTSWQSKSPASVNRALQLVSQTARVARERGSTPGYRIAGLRTVNARTGAELGVPMAMVRVAVQHAPVLLVRALTARQRAEPEARVKARQERMGALAPEVSALRAQHADDPDALNEAIKELYVKHEIDLESCLPPLRYPAAIMVLGAVTRRLLNRLTGKPIVVER